nr:MAG TPA: hypothetical protein [Caudoviricetes sp.]
MNSPITQHLLCSFVIAYKYPYRTTVFLTSSTCLCVVAYK